MHWLVRILAFILFLVAGSNLGFGIYVLVEEDFALQNESHFAFTLSVYSIVWGSVGLVMLLVFLIDSFSSTKYRWSFWKFIWGVMYAFLATAWLIVGQIFLMYPLAAAASTWETFLYGVAIAALVVSYIMLVIVLGGFARINRDMGEMLANYDEAQQGLLTDKNSAHRETLALFRE